MGEPILRVETEWDESYDSSYDESYDDPSEDLLLILLQEVERGRGRGSSSRT